jgi:hypothetical protein
LRHGTLISASPVVASWSTSSFVLIPHTVPEPGTATPITFGTDSRERVGAEAATVSWQIRIPYQDTDDPLDLGLIHDLTRDAIEDEQERAVTRELLDELALHTDCATFGDGINFMEQSSDDEVRARRDESTR